MMPKGAFGKVLNSNVKYKSFISQITCSLIDKPVAILFQVQGYFEFFLPKIDIQQWMSTSIYFLTFAEGWALYAEGDLIADETDAYKSIPLMNFTALRWKVKNTYISSSDGKASYFVLIRPD